MAQAQRVASDGIWYQWTSPIAVHEAGVTFTGWVSRAGNVVVGSIDGTTGDVRQCVVAERLNADDHAAPAIFVRNPDKRLITVYGKHNDKILRWRISENPLDITAWGPEHTFCAPRNTAYPQLVQLSAENNRIYLFFRHAIVGGDQRDWAFLTSDDGGENFDGLTTLRVNFYSHANGVLNPYTVIASDGVERIDFASTNYEQIALGGVPNSVYHWYYRGGNFYRTNGGLIGDTSVLPISGEGDVTVVSSDEDVNLWDISYDGEGNPVVAWVKFEDYHLNHVATVARWDGLQWITESITSLGGPVSNNPGREWYSGGMSLHRSNGGIAYLSIEGGYGQFNVSKWVRAESGWSCQRRFAGDLTRKNFRPVAPHNADDDLAEVLFVAGAYQDLLAYGPTSILAYPGPNNRPYPPKGFRGALRTKSTAQSLPGGATDIAFDKSVYDTDRFGHGTTEFVVPPGVQAVRVSASVRFAATAVDAFLNIVKNGKTHPGMAYAWGPGKVLSASSAVLLVTPGEILTCRVSANGHQIEAHPSTWFAIEVIE